MTERTVSETAQREEAILAFWKEHHVFEKSLQKEAPRGEFVFYEGPPTANGRPGVHHLESRAFKDALPRYKTMRGYHVARRAGWDTHGLPVELEVEKELGFTGKKDIEAYGIAAFNNKCRDSVHMYVSEWQQFTDRIGYWVDQDNAYFTYNPAFMESVWAVLKTISNDDRLYKDYKILPWCARCGTALSSHELAQGYADVKDLSVTVKFALTDEPGTYVLAWTTTPWTLLGNVALAVAEGLTYGTYTNGDESVILSEERAKELLDDAWSVVKTYPGSELVGRTYTALYPYAKDIAPETERAAFEKAFAIYSADFVTTEEGTGVVHTAVMYGTDDFEFGSRVGLPKVHVVGPDGRFLPGTGSFSGRFVKDEDVAVDIIKDLAGRTPNILFSKEKYEHTYPFCWRCKTPLIYYARDSWFIRMHDLRDELVRQNQTVNWEPKHIRDGRMGEWLVGAKEWAVSRERYWGTPLPIWEDTDKTERIVIGSTQELHTHIKKSGNTYVAMRHAEAVQNAEGNVSSDIQAGYGLTERGQEEAARAADVLKSAGITRIYVSPYARAQETAQLIQATLGLSDAAVYTDQRLGEIDFGSLSGGTYQAFVEYMNEHMPGYSDPLPGGESYQQVKERMGAFMYELEETLSSEVILIITHGAGLETLSALTSGFDAVESRHLLETLNPVTGQVLPLPFVALPHNERYELDLHRPYIDSVSLVGTNGQPLMRVPEVMDVWFDSGSMPFAQDHYPFENKERIEGKGYPADFISEAIDQTRGWFYTLLAIGVLTGHGVPYRNVICLGHILDDKGQKMSKSRGNGVDPWQAIDTWGADTLRFWMYSVNQPGDSKNFDEKTVKEAARALSWLDNSAKFYALFAVDGEEHVGALQVIDQWMHARANETVRKVTECMDTYQLYDATRAIALLLEDLSQWYVRRIRDRARDGDHAALSTLRVVLHTCARLLAPFTPFIAEDVYQKVKTAEDPLSVHLTSWPDATHVDASSLIADMQTARSLSSEALMLRQKAGIKVRQPLARLSITGALPEALRSIIAEEVNVKEVEDGADAVALDTELTPELIQEGDVRAFARALAEIRKSLNLSPKEIVSLVVHSDGAQLLREISLGGVRTTTFTDEKGPYTVELSTGMLSFNIVVNAS